MRAPATLHYLPKCKFQKASFLPTLALVETPILRGPPKDPHESHWKIERGTPTEENQVAKTVVLILH
jgi:hypothetical protein